MKTPVQTRCGVHERYTTMYKRKMIDPDVMHQNNQINQLLQKGMTVKDISEELGVSEWLVFKVAKATNAYNDKDGKRII